MLDSTFFIIKPDVLKRNLVGTMLQRIEAAGFEIVGLRYTYATEAKVEEHYREHKARDYFPGLVETLAGQYVVVGRARHRLYPLDSVSLFRSVIGPYDPLIPGTIRGDFAINGRENSVHGSDSADNATRELAVWGGSKEVVLEKSDKWVSVESRLPETHKKVLVFVKESEHLDPSFTIAELAVEDDGESYWSADGFYHRLADDTVTHWAELVGPNGERSVE